MVNRPFEEIQARSHLPRLPTGDARKDDLERRMRGGRDAYQFDWLELSDPPTVVNVSLTPFPTRVSDANSVIEMAATIKPYSTAVAPSVLR